MWIATLKVYSGQKGTLTILFILTSADSRLLLLDLKSQEEVSETITKSLLQQEAITLVNCTAQNTVGTEDYIQYSTGLFVTQTIWTVFQLFFKTANGFYFIMARVRHHHCDWELCHYEENFENLFGQTVHKGYSLKEAHLCWGRTQNFPSVVHFVKRV